MSKLRQHNEWFRPVSLGNRKSCPSCHAKLGAGESIWSWGEYVTGKWRTVAHFCRECFQANVQSKLASHTDDCGCTVQLVGYGSCPLPYWLTLNRLLAEPEQRRLTASERLHKQHYEGNPLREANLEQARLELHAELAQGTAEIATLVHPKPRRNKARKARKGRRQ